MTVSTKQARAAIVQARTYHDPETDVSITVPAGFNLDKPTADGTLMLAQAPPVDGVVDNINLKIVPAQLPEPAAIQSPEFVAKVTEALCVQGASNITAVATTIAGNAALSVNYGIGARPLYGSQLYVPHRGHVLILTVTAGTAERALLHAAAIVVKDVA